MPLRSTIPLSESMTRENAEALSRVFINTAETVGDASPINETITRERLMRVGALAIAYGAGAEAHPAIAATLDWYDAVTSLSNMATWLTEDVGEIAEYSEEARAAGVEPPALDQGPLIAALTSADSERLADAWVAYAQLRVTILDLWRTPELARVEAAADALIRFDELKVEMSEETIAALEATFIAAREANDNYRALLIRGGEEDRELVENARGTAAYWDRLFACIGFDLGALLPEQALS